MRSEDGEMKESQLYAAATKESPLPMAMFTPPEFRCIMANRAFERVFESDCPLLGKGIWDILPETAAEAVPLLEDVIRFGQPRTIDDVARASFGASGLKVRHCSAFLSRVDNTGNGEHAVLMSIIDTTDKVLAVKQIEHALERAEQSSGEWQAIFQAASQGLAVIAEDFRIIAINRAAAEILSFSEYEVGRKLESRLGRDVLRHHSTGEPLDRADYPANRAASGEYVLNFPALLVNRAGRSIDVLISTAPVNSPPGYPRRFIITWQDVTALRALERTKNNFMMVISHELRNPLQLILGLLQTLPQKLGPGCREAAMNGLNLIGAQVRHLNSLAGEILTGYRIDSGRLPVDLSPINIVEVVRQAMAPYLEDRTHVWIGPNTDAEEITLMGDRIRLSQVICNLLSNAMKYTPEGKSIEVRLRHDDSNAAICVLDEGRGIPDDELERVFEGFYRSRTVSDWVSGSIGLGLYISRATARAHGGDLWAENRPGGGTVMCLRLPLAEPWSQTHRI